MLLIHIVLEQRTIADCNVPTVRLQHVHACFARRARTPPSIDTHVSVRRCCHLCVAAGAKTDELAMRRLFQKEGDFKAVSGVLRVTVKKADGLLIISRPDVFSSGADVFVVFGELKVEGVRNLRGECAPMPTMWCV